MTQPDNAYTIIFLMYASMVVITITLAVEYHTSKSRSKDQQLLPPCYITWQNPSYNLVFIAVPMGILMACKLKISWELGAAGLIPISETVFNMALYAMRQIWRQHYTIVILGFVCTCLQLLLIDFCNDAGLPWRCATYFCVQTSLEVAQILYVKCFDQKADPFQRTQFSSVNSVLILLMDLLSIWSNIAYTQPILKLTNPQSVTPYWFDIIGSIAIWDALFVSYFLQINYPHWNIWSVHEIDDINSI